MRDVTRFVMAALLVTILLPASIEVPATSRFDSVQLEYRDGTRPNVVKIDRLE